MEAINIFLKKEQDCKMFDRSLFGIKYWQYVRSLISCEANSTISGGSPMFAKNSFNIKKYFINIKNIKKYFLKHKNYDILFVSQARRSYYKGMYKNNYIDDYIDYLKDEYRIKTIEEPSWSSLGVSATPHDFPIYTEDIYLTDIHEICFLIKKALYKVFKRRRYKRILNEYIDVKNIVNSWYEHSYNSVEFKKIFVDFLIRLDSDRKYIKKLLKKISPKVIMVHHMPSIFKQMLINECNKQNITTVEVQHGTITKVDPLVNKCLDVSKLDNDTKYIISFGENQVSKYYLSIKNLNNVINVGFPFFENILNNIEQSKAKKKYILVISQSTIGDDMANFASELADLIKDYNYKIVFKYHPNEMSKNYKCLKKKNILEIKKEKSIYDIQKQSILQIGSYSTSLYEGFAMKVPTLVVKTMFGSIETVDVFKNIKQGVYYIERPNDVLNFINKKGILPLDKDIKKLWQLGSKERIIKAVKNIMSDRK